jgi:hypothetical protein
MKSVTNFFLLFPSMSLGVASCERLETRLGTEVRAPICFSLAPRATTKGGTEYAPSPSFTAQAIPSLMLHSRLLLLSSSLKSLPPRG